MNIDKLAKEVDWVKIELRTVKKYLRDFNETNKMADQWANIIQKLAQYVDF